MRDPCWGACVLSSFEINEVGGENPVVETVGMVGSEVEVEFEVVEVDAVAEAGRLPGALGEKDEVVEFRRLD